MTVDNYKFREMMTTMTYLLPLDQEHSDAVDAIFGEGFTKEMPQFMYSFAQAMLNYPEDLDGWLTWIQEAILYVRGERKDYPTMTGYPVEKLKQAMRMKMTKMANPEKVKEYLKMEKEALGNENNSSEQRKT